MGFSTTYIEDDDPRHRLYDIDTSHVISSQDGEVIMVIFSKNERTLLRLFLFCHLHQLFYESFQKLIDYDLNLNNQHNSSMECYIMDSKIIQFLIHSLVETGEYTLTGIARYAKIPFDVIFNASRGDSNEFSMTFWIRIVCLYIQVKPEIMKKLIDRLLAMKGKDEATLFSFLFLFLQEP